MFEVDTSSCDAFTIFDAATGRVEGYVMVPKSSSAWAYPGLARWPERLSGSTQWVDPATGQPADRPEMPVSVDKTSIRADGRDLVTFSNIPGGTVVSTPIGKVTVDDGVLEFTASTPGQLFFRFEHFPHKEMEVVIYAN